MLGQWHPGVETALPPSLSSSLWKGAEIREVSTALGDPSMLNLPRWHLLGAGRALQHQQACLSCHLYRDLCLQRGKGAALQPGPGERRSARGGRQQGWSSSLPSSRPAGPKLPLPAPLGCLLMRGEDGAQSGCSIRALGPLVNFSSPAEQGDQTEGAERSCDSEES